MSAIDPAYIPPATGTAADATSQPPAPGCICWPVCCCVSMRGERWEAAGSDVR